MWNRIHDDYSSGCDQIVVINHIDVRHTMPDSGERQYTVWTQKRRFGPALEG